jgi:hypothetical protein
MSIVGPLLPYLQQDKDGTALDIREVWVRVKRLASVNTIVPQRTHGHNSRCLK